MALGVRMELEYGRLRDTDELVRILQSNPLEEEGQQADQRIEVQRLSGVRDRVMVPLAQIVVFQE